MIKTINLNKKELMIKLKRNKLIKNDCFYFCITIIIMEFNVIDILKKKIKISEFIIKRPSFKFRGKMTPEEHQLFKEFIDNALVAYENLCSQDIFAFFHLLEPVDVRMNYHKQLIIKYKKTIEERQKELEENQIIKNKLKEFEQENQELKNKLKDFEKQLLQFDYIIKVLCVKTNLKFEDEKKYML